MVFTKIFGAILLAVGVGIIGWTLSSSYNIFTGKTEVPELFEAPQAVKTQPTTGGKTTGLPDLGDIQGQLGEMLGDQLKGLVPADALPKILNLFVWSVLAGLLIFGGTQIAGLGIRLLK